MPAPLAYLNGRFVPFADAALPLHDAGFVSGATVVDNARTFGGKLFRWPDHLDRLRRDCAACYVPLEPTDDELTAAAGELLTHNLALLPPGGELQVVTFATPGPLGVYLGAAANGPPTVGMVTYPVPFARFRSFFTHGATLALVGAHPVAGETVLPPTVKHRSRMLWHVADHRARAMTGNPAALGVPHDGPTGTLLETSVANVLAVLDGEVVSPPRDWILDGISLRVTRELCGELGIPFVEWGVTPADLPQASEMLLTGTGFGVAGVSGWHPEDGAPVRFAWPGPVYGRLLAAWSERVGVDIAGQFTNPASPPPNVPTTPP